MVTPIMHEGLQEPKSSMPADRESLEEKARMSLTGKIPDISQEQLADTYTALTAFIGSHISKNLLHRAQQDRILLSTSERQALDAKRAGSDTVERARIAVQYLESILQKRPTPTADELERSAELAENTQGRYAATQKHPFLGVAKQLVYAGLEKVVTGKPGPVSKARSYLVGLAQRSFHALDEAVGRKMMAFDPYSGGPTKKEVDGTKARKTVGGARGYTSRSLGGLSDLSELVHEATVQPEIPAKRKNSVRIDMPQDETNPQMKDTAYKSETSAA